LNALEVEVEEAVVRAVEVDAKVAI